MMELAILLCLTVATYLSALAMSLRMLSKSAFHRRLDDSGRKEAAPRLLERLEATVFFTSLLRTCFRIGVFIFVLLEVLRTNEQTTLTAMSLVVSFFIAVFGLWLCTTVISSAIAKYSGTALVVRSLPLLLVFGALGTPLARLVGFIDEAIRRLTGANLETGDVVEAELLSRIEEHQYEGRLDEEAATLLENVVEFRTTDAGEVMTPRTDIEGIEITDDLAAIKSFIIEAGHSRIPVFEENLDNILGILYVKDLVPFLGERAENFSLRSLLRKPIVVPDTKPIPELLSDFQRSEIHLAIVIDEYGGTAGLVTIEDVLEEIVGEIHDEHEPKGEEEPSLETIDETRAEVDGRYHIDDLNEQLQLELPEDDDYDTVAGYVLAQLGRVPEVGDSFEAHAAKFTTLAATPTHVQRIGIELREPIKANGQKKNGNGNANGGNQS